MPVLISPTGVQAVHPTVRWPWRVPPLAGTAMGLSSFASKPIEDVVAANPKTFFQIYWLGGRDAIAERAERARAAGAVGMIVTTDWSFSHGRDWGSRRSPRRWTCRTMVKMSPELWPGPGSVWWAQDPRSHPLTAPSQGPAGQAGPPFFQAYGEWMGTRPRPGRTSPGCASSGAARSCSKGVMRIDDAKRAVDAGCTAISVSNHGGNNLDGTPATIRALPAIAEAVGDQVEVLLDGGVRRGSDVVRRWHARRPRGHDRPGLPVGTCGPTVRPV